ncbi:hypothetical protein N665_0138s0009 [Sinapis alba]|nr:hypothetical protein N665_0138s0009 [Sinapis alba]
MSVDMLFLDSKATLMGVSVAASRVPTYVQQLTAGSLYSVAGFDCFRFRNDSEFFGLAHSNTQLLDLIGELTAVKSTVSDMPGEKNHLMTTIKMDTGASVTLSMFDTHAVALHKRLESMSGDPMVIVATSLNPKIVGGRLFPNATSGTHIYFDKETNAGEAFFYKLVTAVTGLRSYAPLLKKHAKVEHLTISELNDFVISAQSQMDKGWCYVPCTKCTKKLQRTVSAFTCVHCDNPHAVGALRYRVEMGVADDTAEGVFVCFDSVMTKLHNLQANEAGLMLVRVTAYNFTTHHQTFTITRILSERERVPFPDFVENGGNNDGDDGPGANTAPAKAEAGSSGQLSAPGTGATLPAKTSKRPSVNASSKVVKKACIG